jgi:hypothetical protein
VIWKTRTELFNRAENMLQSGKAGMDFHRPMHDWTSNRIFNETSCLDPLTRAGRGPAAAKLSSLKSSPTEPSLARLEKQLFRSPLPRLITKPGRRANARQTDNRCWDQPAVFTALAKGFEGEYTCCRRAFEEE